MRRVSGWIAAAAGLGLACGDGGDGSEAAPANADPSADLRPVQPATVPQLRVDLAGTDGAPRIVRARLRDIPADALPIPSLAGAAVLVGYGQDGVASVAMPFSFPKVLRLEGSRDGSELGAELALTQGSISLYLNAAQSLSRIDVLGESGQVLASLPAADFESAGTARKLRTLQLDGTLSPRAELQRGFPQIEFLGPGESLGLEFDNPISDVLDVVEIGPKAGPAIQDALNRMSEAAFGAVRTVAVAKFNAYKGVGATFGSTVVLSELIDTDPGQMTQTTVHESTHAFQDLVDGGVAIYLLNRRPWPEDVLAAARKTIQDFSLQSGIIEAWDALHGDAVEAGLGAAYLGNDWMSLGQSRDGDIAAAPLGFATAYGAASAAEDQAEYVAYLIVTDNGGPSPACDWVKGAGNPFAAERALPYIKVKLLEGLGLVTAAQSDACVGKPALEGPPGIHLGGVSLDQNIKGGFISLDEGRFLGVLASAPPYEMLIRVVASEQQPRGVYRLDDIGYAGINAATNAVLLGHDTELLRARTSARGLVLVTEYSPQRLAGAVFFLMLRNAAGLVTDNLPFGTFRVDNP